MAGICMRPYLHNNKKCWPVNETRSPVLPQEHDDLLMKIRRALLVLSECSQSMIRIHDELDLLQSICAHIAADGRYSMA